MFRSSPRKALLLTWLFVQERSRLRPRAGCLMLPRAPVDRPAAAVVGLPLHRQPVTASVGRVPLDVQDADTARGARPVRGGGERGGPERVDGRLGPGGPGVRAVLDHDAVALVTLRWRDDEPEPEVPVQAGLGAALVLEVVEEGAGRRGQLQRLGQAGEVPPAGQDGLPVRLPLEGHEHRRQVAIGGGDPDALGADRRRPGGDDARALHLAPQLERLLLRLLFLAFDERNDFNSRR